MSTDSKDDENLTANQAAPAAEPPPDPAMETAATPIRTVTAAERDAGPMSTDSERDEKLRANQTAPAAEPPPDPAMETTAACMRNVTAAERESDPMSPNSERDENLRENQTAPAAEPVADPAIENAAQPADDSWMERAAARIRNMTAAEREAEALEIERHSARVDAASFHRFQKGVSGNPRGRPRKVERSFTPRQQRRDVLRIAESQTTIRTVKSKKKVPIIEAIIRVTAAKALAGHGPSISRMMKWYSDAIDKHTEAHADKFDFLESTEVSAALTLDEMTEYWNNYLNRMRKLTRRT
jgi:hypothetical protein